jgi:hypothetical protein
LVDLPYASQIVGWGGAMAAPTIANIDGDDDLEVVIHSVFSGDLAYELPGTGAAKILWGTGRGNILRKGNN